METEWGTFRVHFSLLLWRGGHSTCYLPSEPMAGAMLRKPLSSFVSHDRDFAAAERCAPVSSPPALATTRYSLTL